MPSRLALRIYLIGLVQFLVVFVAMEATKRIEQQSRPPAFGQKYARYMAEDLARVYDDPVAFDAQLTRMAKTLEWTIEVREGDRVVAHKDSPAPRRESRTPFRGTHVFTVAGDRQVTLDFTLYPSGPPPGMRQSTLLVLVLLVVGVTSFLAARSVTKPLNALAGTTRAFGRGELDARARMKRADEIGQVAATFDDMADRVTRLLLAERELLANVSHELRTPLARIRVALDLANEAEPAIAVESLKDIAEDLAELERIVDDVLAAARFAHDNVKPGASPLPVRREPIVMNMLLEKSAAKFQRIHPGRTLDVEVEGDLPIVEGDPVLVRRVVDNLLDNAHKYSKSKEGRIRLRARSESEDVVVEVKDEGLGITKSDLERVFEPFFRVDRSRTRATGGLGLGLALVKRVVEAHGGTIVLESELGEGTVARVRLPALRAA